MTNTINHSGPLWLWTAANGVGWHFVTIDRAAGEALSGIALMRRLEGITRGFGSLKVRVGIGECRFDTSVFRSKDTGWMLPVKAAVRKAERLAAGDVVAVVLDLR